MRAFLPVAVAAFALVFTATGLRALAGEDEEKCPLDKLPAKVVAAVKAKWPKGELVSASKWKDPADEKKTDYEVKVKNGDATVEATLTEDGKITETEATIAAKDLPKAVSDAISAKYAKSTVGRAVEITAGDKKSYEVVVTTADKKTIEMTIAADGKIVEEEEAGKEEEEKGGDKEKGMGEGGMGGGDMK
jgi:hypothetical protein